LDSGGQIEMDELNNKRGSVKRVLLSDANANQLKQLINNLRTESCKVDASKAVNQIVKIFLNKYLEKDYNEFKRYFFDKKSHLKNLIKNSKNNEELDKSIKDYLEGASRKKKRGRKPKAEAATRGEL